MYRNIWIIWNIWKSIESPIPHGISYIIWDYLKYLEKHWIPNTPMNIKYYCGIFGLFGNQLVCIWIIWIIWNIWKSPEFQIPHGILDSIWIIWEYLESS